MKIAIVIPVLNQMEYFRQTVQSILDTFPKEHEGRIIVVDGGSTDPIETMSKDMELVCQNSNISIEYRNIGEGKGVTIPWNIGLDRALQWGADVVDVSNSDVVYGPRTIERCAEVAVSHGVCFPLSIQNGPLPENFQQLAEERVAAGGHILVNTGGFAGWCFFLSRQTIAEIGRFDEQFTLWFQDTDYHWRLRTAGLTPWEVRSCLLHHFESKTIKSIKDAFDHKGWRIQDQANFEKKWNVKL